MKTIKKTIYVTFLCLSVILASCSSSDDDNSGDGGTDGSEFLTAKVDGSDWAASTDLETLIGAQKSKGNLIIQGSTNTGSFINFTINGYEGIGTYTA
jgi:hypothetical protein